MIGISIFVWTGLLIPKNETEWAIQGEGSEIQSRFTDIDGEGLRLLQPHRIQSPSQTGSIHTQASAFKDKETRAPTSIEPSHSWFENPLSVMICRSLCSHLHTWRETQLSRSPFLGGAGFQSEVKTGAEGNNSFETKISWN